MTATEKKLASLSRVLGQIRPQLPVALEQAAEQIGCGLARLRRLVRSGRIRSVLVNRRRYLTPKELARAQEILAR